MRSSARSITRRVVAYGKRIFRAAYVEAKRLASLGRVADAANSALAAIDADPDYVEAHRLLQDLLARTTSDWFAPKR